ncbi:MAG TPA: uracil-DNA glycosylase [Gemmataceae bacterium]|nr:uracil-DNA glycosylase [Gemmataceae bacterium]
MNDDVTRQLRTRLSGLAAAGIDWLPRAEIPTFVSSESSVADEPSTGVEVGDRRVIELKLLTDRVRACDRCPELVATRTQTVFGVGPLGAELLFLGEAPGADEDRQGEPFVGAAGQMLNRIITGCGLKREEIFICNILRCRPPGNRQPKPDEAANCREYLDGTIDLVQPKVICCWGAVAAQNLLGTTTGITRLRGRFYEYRGIPVLCTFHPAALLEGRSPEKKKDVWEDMKMLLTRIGRPIPGVKKG